MSKIKILKPSPIIFGFLLISLPLLLKGTYATAYYMFLPCLGRRIEDKMEAKGLDAESVFLRFDTPPANKKVALSYQAWIINMKGPNVEQLFVVPRQAQWSPKKLLVIILFFLPSSTR